MQAGLRSHQREVESRLDEAKDRFLALMNPLKVSVSGIQSDLTQIGRRLAGIETHGTSGTNVPSPEPPPAESALGADPLAEIPDEGLPELPSDVQPVILVKHLDLKDFFEDTRFNPDGKELAPVERLRAIEVLRTGKAWMEVLDSRMQVELAVGMEGMREQGRYVEYGKGESREAGGPGTVTAAESAGDNRIRMFYFDPSEFPEIAAKKQQITKVAENTVKRLLQLAAK